MTTLHDFTADALEGEPVDLGRFAGKVALVVNVASRCGLTPHYEGLEKLYRDKKDAGLVVLGFPCNQFGRQEPGTAEEIRAFCTSRYDVSFPMFSKIDVNGDARHPLYAWLTSEDTKPDGPGDVKWNFAKFVVGKDGRVVARFDPSTEPGADALVQVVDEALMES